MKWRAVVALAASVMMLVGCGKSAGEKAAEGLVNSLLGGAGIQIGDGGNSITLTGEDGSQLNLSGAKEGEIPAGFVLPVLPGMKTDGFVETRSGGKVGWIGSLYFDGDIEATANAYEQALINIGIEPGMMAMKDEDGFTAIFFASGSIGGKHYGGMLSISEDGTSELGKNVLSVMFSEADPPEDD